MVQLQSYGFTIVENPMSDNGNFSIVTGLFAGKVISSGVYETIVAGHQAAQIWTAAVVQTGDSWPNDQYSEVTILTQTPTAGGNVFGPICRCSNSADTSYQVNCSGQLGSANAGVISLLSVASGTGTQIGTASNLTFNVGDVLRLTCTGTTIAVTQNGTSRVSVTDSTVTAGFPGMSLKNATNIADGQLSLWAAGANQAAVPTFNPPAGTYTGTQTVTISSTTAGGTIFYTTNGTTPTHSSSSISNGGIVSVSSSQTIKAFESVSNFADSTLATAAYTINSSGSGGGTSNDPFVSVNINSSLRGVTT